MSLGGFADHPARTLAHYAVAESAKTFLMKNYFLLLILLFGFPGLAPSAVTHYVDLDSTNPVAPYTDWSTAATNIQNAVDAATNGDLILVTNGIYNTGQTSAPFGVYRLAVQKLVTVQSVNGPGVTAIQGYITNGPAALRCVYLATNATLVGFTLTNGATSDFSVSQEGGGIFCQSTAQVSGSRPPYVSATVSNCVLVGNSAALDGGGSEFGTFYNCVFSNNIAQGGGGAAIDGRFYNCLFTGNSAYQGGAIANSLVPTILNNCTVYGNFATNRGGGLRILNAISATNSIVFGNICTNGSNYSSGLTMNYCCTAPLPTTGVGNIITDPLLVNPSLGDFHLQSTSPCINSGNNAGVTFTNDLDGNPRIVGSTVDIGAYEYQTPTSVISYAWLQQYGLPTDGSVDFADLDGTSFNVYQDWIAGLNPTNAASVLLMQTPQTSTNSSGVTVIWLSVSNRTYYLQQATNLATQPAFSTIRSNIAGQAGTTSFTDVTATNSGPYFYRVGVQH